MKLWLQYSTFLIIVVSISDISCQRKDDPQPTISPFTVLSKQRTGVADLRPSHFVNDLVLTWDKARVSNGDSITYAIVYKDTLIKNLADTTFIISNVGDHTVATGFVVARTKRGLTMSVPFSFTSGVAPRIRIKKWTYVSDTYKVYRVVSYSYDSLGHLASFNTFEGKVCCFGYGQTTIFKYNEVGQLSSVEGLPSPTFQPYLYTYEYDTKGNVLVIHRQSAQTDQLPYIYSRYTYLTYSGNSRLPTNYTFMNGNILYSEGPTSIAQYDAMPNPFYGLLNTSANENLALTYSKNNFISKGGTYTYDSNNLIIKAVAYDPKVAVNNYEYEPY